MNRPSFRWLSIALLVSTITSLQFAHAADNRGGYVAFGIGKSKFDATADDLVAYYSHLATPEETTFSTDDLDVSLFGGFRVSRYFAVEGGYEYFGRYRYHIGTRRGYRHFCLVECVYTDYEPGDFSVPVHAIRIQARGSWPVVDRVTVDAAAGLALAYARSNDPYIDDGFGEATKVVDFFNFLYTVGISVKTFDRWWLRVDYSYLSASNDPPHAAGDVATIKLGLERHFFGR